LATFSPRRCTESRGATAENLSVLRSCVLRIIVIIPAFNEARSIGKVVGDIPGGLVEEVVVVNNGSTDETEQNAARAGATVLRERRKGYGWACLRGIAYAMEKNPGIVVFLDGDYSDHPDEMSRLVQPILDDEADLVVGSRMIGNRESGAMLPQAVIGNRVACVLMRLIWGARFTDLGPFRAVTAEGLQSLNMTDKTYGWTVEMQIKAVRTGLRCMEVPVSYRRRVGVSKVTGTLTGTVKASAKILFTIARYAISRA
jgi:glycosyltransferase involved in cell wall biosynthesis